MGGCGLLLCLEDGVGSPHEELVKLQLQVIQGGRRRQGAVVRLEVEPVVWHEGYGLSETAPQSSCQERQSITARIR